MKATSKDIKAALHKSLKELYGRGYRKELAKRSGYSAEAVRQYFTVADRVNPLVEHKAFELVEELKEQNQIKLNTLKS